MEKKIVITIPAYNEEKTIGLLIEDIHKVMKQNSYNYKILVVDDGSRDRTKETAEQAGAIVISHPKNYGLAEVYRTEMKKALEMGADFIVHIDADKQYLAEEIPLLAEPVLKDEADLVLGSRFKGHIEEMPLLKKIGNKAFSYVVSQITRAKISDAQTGFRAFNKAVAEIPITSDHTYTQETIIKSVRKKLRIKETPIHFARRKNGKSRLVKNSLEYATKAGINILRIFRDYEPLKFFLLAGMIFLIPGFLAGLYVTYLFLTTGIVGHIPTVMLTVLFISIGVQITLFGFLADMQRK